YAPHGRAMEIEAEIVRQEVNHGKIVAELIEGLGANPNQYRPIKQYAFHIPLEDWIDLAWFHALIDRVGLYVGIEMTGAPTSRSPRRRPSSKATRNSTPAPASCT